LRFFPDNFLIDYAGCDVSVCDTVPLDVCEVPLLDVKDRTGASRVDVEGAIAQNDDRYLVTEPRDVYYFAFDLPRGEPGEQTLFLRSRGYYTEWLRGGWVMSTGSENRFDLFEVRETMDRLASMWLRERPSMESLFFRNRVPLSEGL
jgi:hypothetical protein